MFAIDLLNGEGVPVKSGPQSIAIAAAAFGVPIIVVILLFGFYMSNAAAISVQRQQIDNYQIKLEEFSEALAQSRAFENQTANINSVLSEVSTAIHRDVQWSPVIVTIVESIPETLLLTGLEVKQHNTTRKVPTKADPETMRDKPITLTILKIQVSGKSSNNIDAAGRDFKDRLGESQMLGPKLEDIRLAKDADPKSGDGVVSYEIDCIFKPQL
jgi:hypothetical protein